MIRMLRRLVLVLAVILAPAHDSGADIGVVILEPIKALGFFTRVGYAGTFLSNICPDGSPIRVRLCRTGEREGVVSKYSSISEHDDYDWRVFTLFRQARSSLAAPAVELPAPHDMPIRARPLRT
jgi:hypothetical protein